jgi:hypothetical protein
LYRTDNETAVDARPTPFSGRNLTAPADNPDLTLHGNNKSGLPIESVRDGGPPAH